jgi:two-component system, LytTR family, response regulator
MTSLLIDDEEVHRRGLRQLLALVCPEVQVIGEVSSLAEAQAWLSQYEADVVFLDIMLGDGTGLDLLKSLPERSFQVILVSAHDEFALEAFRLVALDYLLKPIDAEDLQAAVQRAKQQLKYRQTHLQLETLSENLDKLNAQNRKIVLRDADNLYVVPLAEVLYCRAEGSYTVFRLRGEKEIVVSRNIGEYEKLLASAQFVRSHHSYMINLNLVSRFDKTDGGQLVMQDGSSVPVATRKKEALLKALGQFLQ